MKKYKIIYHYDDVIDCLNHKTYKIHLFDKAWNVPYESHKCDDIFEVRAVIKEWISIYGKDIVEIRHTNDFGESIGPPAYN